MRVDAEDVEPGLIGRPIDPAAGRTWLERKAVPIRHVDNDLVEDIRPRTAAENDVVADVFCGFAVHPPDDARNRSVQNVPGRVGYAEFERQNAIAVGVDLRIEAAAVDEERVHVRIPTPPPLMFASTLVALNTL